MILDATGRIVAANDAWRAFCRANGGDDATHYVGTNYLGICQTASGSGSSGAALIPDGLDRVLKEGTPFRCEYPCDSPTEKRWFEMTADRLRVNGQPFVIVQHRNVTVRHREQASTEDAYIRDQAQAALVAASNDAILAYDLDGRIVTWNRAAERLYGYTEAEAAGQSLEILYPPNWPKRIAEYRDEILAGKLTSFEAERVAKDGSTRIVWVSCAPIRGVDGDIIAISNIHRDVTSVRRAEEARHLIAQEVMHRAKNMLTVVSAIHRQTARGATSLEDFNTKFGARLQALSTSTDLLVSGNWTTVSLAELVKSQTGPFFSDGSARVAVEGPPVLLQPQAVQVLGLALHELSTNAAKHGALRREGGHISIRWRLQPGASPQLLFTWAETFPSRGGAPTRQGFGNTVLTALSNSMLDAQARYELGEEQVEWSLEVPSQHFSAGTVP